MSPKLYLRLCGLSILAVVLFGCGSVPPPEPPVVQGNGHCTPSADLPSKKTMKAVPVVDTILDDFWSLFAGERKDHAKDIDDYNSLYRTCVGDPKDQTTKK